MKKYIIGIILGIIIAAPLTTLAVGEWSDWWKVGQYIQIKRVYDHENKLVCWVLSGSANDDLDCEPSLVLDHPLLTD